MEFKSECRLSDNMRAKARKLFQPFLDQYEAASAALIEATKDYPIALCALFGSMLKGASVHSDIDIMVLVRDDYRDYGDILDIKFALEDIIDASKVNNIPVDLQVRSVSGFLDTTRGTEFKRSFCEHNEIFWEDGVSVGREFIRDVEAV